MSEMKNEGSERSIEASKAAGGGFERISLAANFLGFTKMSSFQGRQIAVCDEETAYHVAYLKPDGSIVIYTEELILSDNFLGVWENFAKLVADFNDAERGLAYPAKFITAIGEAIGEKYVEKA